jgi:nucleoside deoxyribosyltransferase
MKTYIAAPFFNPAQIERVEAIKRILDHLKVDYYSPKDDCLYTPTNGMLPKEVVDSNCDAIDKADFMIAVTDDKDVGTMFECGYAYSTGIPIFYIWGGYTPEAKFNIMLAESAYKVCHTYSELHNELYDFIHDIKPIQFQDRTYNYE